MLTCGTVRHQAIDRPATGTPAPWIERQPRGSEITVQRATEVLRRQETARRSEEGIELMRGRSMSDLGTDVSETRTRHTLRPSDALPDLVAPDGQIVLCRVSARAGWAALRLRRARWSGDRSPTRWDHEYGDEQPNADMGLHSYPLPQSRATGRQHTHSLWPIPSKGAAPSRAAPTHP
jgi:hypothetical protein